MNGILGMIALLLDINLSSTQKDYAQTAQDCGKVQITLINEVLDRAKIEAAKLELESVPFDLRSILDDVLSLFSEKSRSKGGKRLNSLLSWLQSFYLIKLHSRQHAFLLYNICMYSKSYDR
ncbi:histidine kinase 4-like isoform X5 [Durio zibethinus]|uniref:histidine kinase n=1 Tax=Durio zibethinus TaxID=66656 RepID=A0A6P5XYE1_DURZI|nr:histidine kinase 4-like isoform X5 [Durio zibethinus]